MIFKGKADKVIHRLGYRFQADNQGNLVIDIDSLKKRVIELDAEGNEVVTREAISKEEKEELLSAIKAYGFSEVVSEVKKKVE
jgi:hypothetical protein